VRASGAAVGEHVVNMLIRRAAPIPAFPQQGKE
jgi:hypothetical protein